MQRYGVATMMILGPTESLVIADDTADPVRLAADLLIEAEHGTDSAVVLVTTSTDLRRPRSTPSSTASSPTCPPPAPRRPGPRSAPNGGCVLVADLDEAAAVANRWAPEHLQVAVDAGVRGRAASTRWSTPARSSSASTRCSAPATSSSAARRACRRRASPTCRAGITADAFLKRTAVARADADALARMTPTIVAMSDHEGFPAHANAALIRRR